MSTNLAELTGYVEQDLDADLAYWFPGERPVSIASTIRPVEPFLARLPVDAARALESLDRKVRGGTLTAIPTLDIAEDWSYGFDFIANGVELFHEDDEDETDVAGEVWCLGLDGDGNQYVVLASGRVALWNHEEGVIERDSQFNSIDVFLWTMVRVSALRAGILRYADIEPEFNALGQQAPLMLLDRQRGPAHVAGS